MWLSFAETRRLLAQIRELKEKIASLEGELRDERDRSRRREDDLVDRVLTASGRHALTPDPKKTIERKPPPSAPLTALEEATLRALRERAVAIGRPTQEADQFFEARRNGKPFSVAAPDEPYILPS